jgi:hypothetical protein
VCLLSQLLEILQHLSLRVGGAFKMYFWKNLVYLFKYNLDEINHYNVERMNSIEDYHKALMEEVDTNRSNIAILRKGLTTQKTRVTRQQNEQNKEKFVFSKQLETLNKKLNGVLK